MFKNNKVKIKLSLFLLAFTMNSSAGEADIVEVKVQHNGGDAFQFITTVKHADTGWKHYANAWEVLDLEGRILGTRVLHHPHVNEQPFTRSLRLTIPVGIKKVIVRAVDSVHTTGGKTVTVILPR